MHFHWKIGIFQTLLLELAGERGEGLAALRHSGISAVAGAPLLFPDLQGPVLRHSGISAVAGAPLLFPDLQGPYASHLRD